MSTELAEALNVVSTRAREIPPFLAMDVLDHTRVLEKEGREIVHMELGEPDWPTAPHVVEAAYKAIKDGYTTYTPTQGLLELREAISEYYEEQYGLEINPDRIVVTMGTSPALFLVFGVLLEAGDEVVLSDPHYACYPNTVSFMGGKPVFFDLKEDEGFVYSGGRVKEKISPRT
ncbi:MAG: aminotransferase class I/II-fold pyridoxal phosphate-dependent enzyme, partial [Candidatus Aminicenantes bacterium]|nr:aminotransferase class I/II-fold pyridoxal phosphate-dependent enzyme [Candidatus Aminicenantes bacterium]